TSVCSGGWGQDIAVDWCADYVAALKMFSADLSDAADIETGEQTVECVIHRCAPGTVTDDVKDYTNRVPDLNVPCRFKSAKFSRTWAEFKAGQFPRRVH